MKNITECEVAHEGGLTDEITHHGPNRKTWIDLLISYVMVEYNGAVTLHCRILLRFHFHFILGQGSRCCPVGLGRKVGPLC